MAALTGPRNTLRRGDYHYTEELPVKANSVLHHGGIVATDATGYVVPGAVSTALKLPGRFNASPERKLDNTGGANGAKTGKVEYGTFRWANSSAGDLIVQADVGQPCYIVDDQTVAKTNGTNTRSKAGTIVAVDSSGVWVFMPLGGTA